MPRPRDIGRGVHEDRRRPLGVQRFDDDGAAEAGRASRPLQNRSGSCTAGRYRRRRWRTIPPRHSRRAWPGRCRRERKAADSSRGDGRSSVAGCTVRGCPTMPAGQRASPAPPEPAIRPLIGQTAAAVPNSVTIASLRVVMAPSNCFLSYAANAIPFVFASIFNKYPMVATCGKSRNRAKTLPHWPHAARPAEQGSYSGSPLIPCGTVAVTGFAP